MMRERRTPGVRTIDEGEIVAIDHVSFALVATKLVHIIGLRSVAALAGVCHTDLVRSWMQGADMGNVLLSTGLRETLKAMRYLAMSDGPGVAKTWFFS